MKIKKIAALCKQAKKFYLYNQRDQNGMVIHQWLGNDLAMYLLDRMPPLDESSLRATLDISEADKGKFAFQLTDVPPMINIADNDPTEREVEDKYPPILYRGDVLAYLRSNRRPLFVDVDYLSPLDGPTDVIRLFERETADRYPYIAVKTGLLIKAIIAPYVVNSRDYLVSMASMARECLEEMDLQETRKQNQTEVITFDDLLKEKEDTN